MDYGLWQRPCVPTVRRGNFRKPITHSMPTRHGGTVLQHVHTRRRSAVTISRTDVHAQPVLSAKRRAVTPSLGLLLAGGRQQSGFTGQVKRSRWRDVLSSPAAPRRRRRDAGARRVVGGGDLLELLLGSEECRSCRRSVPLGPAARWCSLEAVFGAKPGSARAQQDCILAPTD